MASCVSQGDRFVFEDGAEARFWGTNFNSGANFPPHDYAEMVARRLAKFGVNIVRTHQMDAEWATPNLFQFNRAQPKDHTRTLDPESLDRLDYLIYCLKREGIYLYLDLLTYRQFRPGDGVDAVDELPQAAKPYLYFDRRLIELQKEFNEALWTHVNPYTGLAYCDDPAIVLTELVNESDFFANPVILEPYRTRLEDRYLAWVDAQELPRPALPVDFRTPDAQLAGFLVDGDARLLHRDDGAPAQDRGQDSDQRHQLVHQSGRHRRAERRGFFRFTRLLELPPLGERRHERPADGEVLSQRVLNALADASGG